MLKIFEANRSLARITAQFTAAGLNLTDFLSEGVDDTALKAHLDSLKTVEKVTFTDTKSFDAIVTALASTGLQFDATQPDTLAKSVNDHIALKAQELTASLGTKPVQTAPTASADAAAAAKAAGKPELHGADRIRADFQQQAVRAAARARN